MSSILPSFITTDTKAFYGVSTSSSTGSALINEFRKTLGLRVDQPIPDDEETEKLYVAFLAGKITTEELSEAVNALSPKEAEARAVVFQAFALAIKLLRVIQETMRTQSQLLSLYSAICAEMTKQMSQVPIYGPTIKNKMIADSIDFGNTKLGYADTTVRQVFQYLLQKIRNKEAAGKDTTDPVKWEVPTWQWQKDELDGGTWQDHQSTMQYSNYTFSLQKTDTGYSASIKLSDHYVPDNSGVDEAIVSATGATGSSSLSGLALDDSILNQLMQQMTTSWNTTDDSKVIFDGKYYLCNDQGSPVLVPIGTIKMQDIKSFWSTDIPLPLQDFEPVSGKEDLTDSDNQQDFKKALLYTLATGMWGPWEPSETGDTPGAWPETLESFDDQGYDDDETTAARNAASSYRAELNAQLQISLTSIQARKGQIENTQKNTQSVIDQTNQSIQDQANLCETLMQDLKDLITAIFQ